MKTSPLWDEIRAEGVRATVLDLGRLKFRKPPTRKQQKTLEGLSNLDQLQRLAARLLDVDSWAELLNGLD